MIRHVFASSFLASLGYAAAASSLSALPCDSLAGAGLQDRLLLPNDTAYQSRLDTWPALNTRQSPWCIVLPHNTFEVSLILKTLVETGSCQNDWHFALKSGGHGPPGSNNIDDGVTIDLGMMNSSFYDAATTTARIDAGGRWRDVYADLDAEGVVVVGGRDGDVGVGGFLLGGGISYFTPTIGFGCDNVVNYEVVLADGSIVNANATSNADLFKALKGGGSNFGIVTRYDVTTLPTRKFAYDLLSLSANYSDAVVDTIVEFANYPPGEDAFVTYVSHDTSKPEDLSFLAIHVNTAGDTDAATSYDNLKQLPTFFESSTLQTMAEIAAGPGASTIDQRASSTTLLFKNNPEIIRHALKLHEEYVESLSAAIGPDSYITMTFFQPTPSYIGQIGDNMLGIDNLGDNAVMFTGGVAVLSNEEDHALADEGLRQMTAQIKQFAESVDGSFDFIYLNYAHQTQDPLGSYGTEQVQFLREVAGKYDPTGVFQDRFPGGFKISNVA